MGGVDGAVRKKDIDDALRALQGNGAADVAIRAAAQVPSDALGMASFALACRPSVRDGLLTLSRYLKLVHRDVELALRPAGEFTRIELRLPASGNDDSTRMAAELLFARILNHVRGFAQLQVKKVTFRHAPVPYRAAYDALFAAPIEFSRDTDAMWIDNKAIESKQPAYDSATGARIRRAAMATMRSLPPVGTTSSQVREVILDELIAGIPHMTRVSSRLGMNVPVLATVLRGESTTFAGLREELLYAYANQCFRDEILSRVDVAFVLGFIDFDVFSRTYARWSARAD